jgi:hypothetical protein
MPNGELAIASIYGRDIHITGDSRAALYAVNGGSIELDHFSIDAIGMMNAYANSGQITLRSGIAKHGQFAIAIDARVDGKPPACVKAFDSTFAGLKRSAQVAGKNASLQLERCELRESWDSAIALDDRSSLLMLNSKISDCGLGLRMIEASRAELRHCQITACHWLAAILQDPDSELLIERSLISKNLRGHQPLLPIDEQLRAALAVQSGARLIIRDSEISQHKGIGLIVGDSSLALTRNLQMSRNSDGNELVRGSGRIEARGISNEPR